MKQFKVTMIFLLCIFLTACAEKKDGRQTEIPAVTATPSVVLKETPRPKSKLIVRRNCVINNQKYRYIKYEMLDAQNICIWYMIPTGKNLTIPSEIDGYRVLEIGKRKSSDIEREFNVIRQKKIRKVIINEGVEVINEEAFRDAKVKEVVLPDTTQTILQFAFCGSTVKTINLKSVENIGTGAFMSCGELKEIALKKTVIAEHDAFAYCEKLEKITLPPKMTGNLGGGCFSQTGVKRIEWPEFPKEYDENEIGEGIFMKCPELKTVEFRRNNEHIYISPNMFSGCKKIRKLIFPKGTGQVTYQSSPCADNYTDNVTTLEFKDGKTKLKGCDDKFITINRIIAPSKSYAAKYAKKAVRIKKFTKIGLKGVKRDGTAYYNGSDNLQTEFEKGSVILEER